MTDCTIGGRIHSLASAAMSAARCPLVQRKEPNCVVERRERERERERKSKSKRESERERERR